MISIDEVSMLARALLDADEAVKIAEGVLNSKKEQARVIREETIPSVMQELGLESLVLNTGQKLEVKQEVYCSVPKENKTYVYNWLDENGFGGLIKTEVTVSYGKNEKELADELQFELLNRGLEVVVDQNVHAQTMKAFLKEQLAKGAKIPLDLFGARPVWSAKIKQK